MWKGRSRIVMVANGDDAMDAIREQLQEQELALLEIEVALQHDKDAEVLQVLSSIWYCRSLGMTGIKTA